jgi:hypothetical protein
VSTRLVATTGFVCCSFLIAGSTASSQAGHAPAPPASAAVTLGPGSVAEFDVKRLVSASSKPAPSDTWQQIHEKRTVLSRAAGTLEVRVEEDFGPGTQPSVRTERVAAVPDLPAAPKGASDVAAGGIRHSAPDGVPYRTWVGRETIVTPAGTFECTRIAVEITQISSGTHIDEWYADGLPWPVRSSSVTGAGATHFARSELVKLDRR